jgi:hypothetical protein
MPRKIGTENWRKKRRQEHLEMKEYRYYIFCEGEQTEPRYFSGFKKLIEEKVRLYMEQTNDRADTLPLDNAEELPFD